MVICTLVSGSSGNSTYISDGTTSVLVDAGVTGKRIEKELADIGVSCGSLSAILVTHEHIDHVTGVGVLARRYRIPVYANLSTMRFLDANRILDKIMPENQIVFQNGVPFVIGSLVVNAFPIPHDAVDPVGFSFVSGGVKVSVSTDIGEVTETVKKNITGSAAILLEANHDVEMLKNGSYPYQLKKRILGKNGHLCNENCAGLAADLAENGTKTVILGHLSEENNLPELAFKAVEEEFERRGIRDCRIITAPRYSHGEIVTC